MKQFKHIKDFNNYMGYKSPKKDFIDIVKFEEYDELKLSSPKISIDFFLLAYKRKMTDLSWFGNTEYDTDSGFLYFIKPNQEYEWDSDRRWEGFHITVSPILIQDYHLDFSFFQYEINEALFLTKEEQSHIETLFAQIHTEYEKDSYEIDLLIAYTNLILTYIGKCYKRQFDSRQPLYNKLILEFKKLLNSFYNDNPNALPTVSYFAQKLNLSTNYFGDLIKHHTGKTASELIQEKIIKEAKMQLQSSDKTIAEIGYDLGFEYPTYFGRFFKKHTRLTPSKFRQQK